MGNEFVSLVRLCIAQHFRLRGVGERRGDWTEGFEVLGEAADEEAGA